jgi:hypothetical protein
MKPPSGIHKCHLTGQLAGEQDEQVACDGMRGPNPPFKHAALHCRAQVVILPLPAAGPLRPAILSAP